MGQGESGRGVRREAEGRDGGRGQVRSEVGIVRAETRSPVGGSRVEVFDVG